MYLNRLTRKVMFSIEDIDGKLEAYKAVTHPGSLKILVVLSRNPAGFTEIMFGSKLSPSVLNKLLKVLITHSIVSKNGGKYILTSKGEQVLRILLEVVNAL